MGSTFEPIMGLGEEQSVRVCPSRCILGFSQVAESLLRYCRYSV